MSDAEQTYYEVILSVPSAMYFECLILGDQLYGDHPRAKKSSHSTSCLWTCWASPNAKWGGCSSWITKPKAIQVSFDLIRVARPITARDHKLYLLALGERAGVPMNCEDFFRTALTVTSIYIYVLAFFSKNLFHRRDHGLVDLFSLIA